MTGPSFQGTSAGTKVPSDNIPIPPGVEGNLVTIIVGGVLSLLAGLLVARRRLSRDTTEMTKDRAETNLIETLIRERDQARKDAREAWDHRMNDVQLIAKLTAQNEALLVQINAIKEDLFEARLQIRRLHNEVARLNPSFNLVIDEDAMIIPQPLPAKPANPPNEP